MGRYHMMNWSRSSLLLFFFSFFICFESYRLDLGTLSAPGPGLFPFGGGLILGLLSLIEMLKPSIEENKPEKGEGKGGYRIALVLFALTAYGLILERLGFLIATFGLLIFLLKVVVPQKWPRVLVSAFLSTLISYLVFEVWLKTQLPRGILGF